MRTFLLSGVMAATVFFVAGAASAEASCQQADFNRDGVVDEADVEIFKTSLGKSAGDAGYIAAADLDGSGSVTTADYGLLLTCN